MPDWMDAKWWAQRKRGRPVQVTMAVIEHIGSLVAEGMPERAACALVTPPVCYESFRSAKRRKPKFALVIEQAQAEFLFAALTAINVDGPGSAGCRWILERRRRGLRFAETHRNRQRVASGSWWTATQRSCPARQGGGVDRGQFGALLSQREKPSLFVPRTQPGAIPGSMGQAWLAQEA
jgi:hypothetical protein